MAKSKHPERKLLVEGKTDLFFIAELWKKQRNTDALNHFQIVPMDGKERLIQSVSDNDDAIWKPEITHLGIVVDADANAETSLQSVCDALNRRGIIGFSRELHTSGNICTIDGIRIGVWVMPDNKREGILRHQSRH